MDRIRFLKKLIRISLLALLSIIVFMLGSKVVTGQDCSSCPINGTCNGTTDCDK